MLQKYFIALPFFMIILFNSAGYAQHDSLSLQIAFYNTENLFDTQDDSTKNDDPFTPTGANHWTYSKFKRKINNIAKVFIAMGNPDPPAIIGLTEIENKYVLQQLCYKSPLAKFRYNYVHYDSPDARGIDVALLYRQNHVELLNSLPIPVIFPFEPKSQNRDILYVLLKTQYEDTLHIFVNHWTSRYSGYAATIPKRNHYARLLRNLTDSILQTQPNASIIIMGDFNDYPTDESLSKILEAKSKEETMPNTSRLVNLMLDFENRHNHGTHKHQDFWGCLDQFIVSETLLNPVNKCYIKNSKAEIFKADFMVVPDDKYGGEKVFRTFLGPKYLGGFADHLPIFLWLTRNKE